MSILTNFNCISSPVLLSNSETKKFFSDLNNGKLDNWELDDTRNLIHHEFKFKNYYDTIAFVNAVAWIVHQEDHHPDIKISYNKCHISFSTHSVSGLSKNDFICAAKINHIVAS